MLVSLICFSYRINYSERPLNENEAESSEDDDGVEDPSVSSEEEDHTKH